jgi:CTP:molybdopterin cytidylyltransferase MocA
VTDARPAAVVVLAAGEGTRMRSTRTPKVLHPLGGRSMLGHVVAAARALDPQHLLVVVGTRASRSRPTSASSTPRPPPWCSTSRTAPGTPSGWPSRGCPTSTASSSSSRATPRC